MSDLRELFQELILDHGKRPRNFRLPEKFDREAEGFNPLCGDKIHLYVGMDDDGRIRDVAFQGKGCAISQASASMMSEFLKGRTREEATAMFEKFHTLVTEGPEAVPAGEPELGKLEVFGGVKNFPMRVKCATLAWHTFNAAMKGEAAPVSTE